MLRINAASSAVKVELLAKDFGVPLNVELTQERHAQAATEGRRHRVRVPEARTRLRPGLSDLKFSEVGGTMTHAEPS